MLQRYGSLSGSLYLFELEKDPAASGLGITLTGNNDGSRARTSVFVADIDPQGPAGLDGRIRIGDELLEVEKNECRHEGKDRGRLKSYRETKCQSRMESSNGSRGLWVKRSEKKKDVRRIYQTNYHLKNDIYQVEQLGVRPEEEMAESRLKQWFSKWGLCPPGGLLRDL